MSVEPGRDDELLPVAAGAVLAEFMGYCLTGPIGPWAAALVGASLTPGMSRLMVNVVAEWRARFGVVAEAAQSAAGLSQEELLETFADRPDLQPLLERVASAVKNTRLEPKLRILGTILGESIDKRPTEVDISMLLAATIDDLEAPHLRVIAILAVDPEPKQSRGFLGCRAGHRQGARPADRGSSGCPWRANPPWACADNCGLWRGHAVQDH